MNTRNAYQVKIAYHEAGLMFKWVNETLPCGENEKLRKELLGMFAVVACQNNPSNLDVLRVLVRGISLIWQ